MQDLAYMEKLNPPVSQSASQEGPPRFNSLYNLQCF